MKEYIEEYNETKRSYERLAEQSPRLEYGSEDGKALMTDLCVDGSRKKHRFLQSKKRNLFYQFKELLTKYGPQANGANDAGKKAADALKQSEEGMEIIDGHEDLLTFVDEMAKNVGQGKK